jgi:signal transduction histidine kinase
MRDRLKKIQFAHNKEIKRLQLLASALAHELRIPLTAVTSLFDCLQDYLPDLLKAYYTAIHHNLVQPIFTDDLEAKSLLGLSQRTKQEIVKSNQFINLVLLLSKEQYVKPEAMQVLSIESCLQEALQHFPFKDKENDLIHIDMRYDFKFKGVLVLFEHIMFNLIKNALFYIEQEGKGKISIWADTGISINDHHWNILHFKDTAKGISKQNLEILFTQFFSKRKEGTGIGLAFSNQLMVLFGGEISCEAVEGEYTHFILKFPVIA